MKYGHFDDKAREYVIDTPRTPYPWINYLGSENFFGIISNTAGGYCFYRDARLRRITRYRYNNLPVDNGGRYFYIKDGDTVWNPGWKPTKTELDAYSCRHGMGYTVITGEKNGVEARQLSFVPLGLNAEVHQIALTNKTGAARDLILTSFVEFCLWNAQDDMLNFQRNFSTGEVEVEGSVIYHKTEYRERRNHYSFFAVNKPVDGFDTDMETFLGLYNGFDAPQSVVTGKMGNSVASGWQPMAAHQFRVTLAPGETRKFNFVLGYVELPVAEKFQAPGVINKKPARELLDLLTTDEQIDAAFVALKKHWDNLLSAYTLTTNNEKLSRMVNIWNPYQCMVTFNMSRSTSMFESGIGRGMGFRDSSQDLLGFVHQIPERARERILDIAATQFRDGGCYHQFQPLTKKGNNDIGGGFNDDPLWLIAGTAAYIKETGDYGILDEATPYDCNPDDCGTLMEHLEVSFYHVVNNLGPHGLPLIGRADWNDCLNLNCHSTQPGESFQTPEAVLVYSSKGLNGMSQIYHRLYRTRLARGYWRDRPRPVLINNWEGTYFDFDEDKLFRFAQEGKELGIELFVMDDGWFGKRNSDNCSLGDWTANLEKLPRGLAGLSERIHGLDMLFGLWMEPEMISPDSDLYRAHPDWCLHVPGRARTEERNQLILDLTRQEVRDYVTEAVTSVLRESSADYLKWDMNRNMTEYFSPALPPERRMEAQHRYMLGLYEIMETVTRRFPQVLFESCSGGGGRFDPGMLFYMPQTWTSDNTDAVCRLGIQYGTSYVYPASAMGAHVSAVPNHQCQRTTPLRMRGDVALCGGSFGLELDVTILSEEEKEQARAVIERAKEFRGLVQQGTFWRLLSPSGAGYAAWQFVRDDGKQTLVCVYRILSVPNLPPVRVKLAGLDPDASFRDETGKLYSGAALMYLGLSIGIPGDFGSCVLLLEKAE